MLSLISASVVLLLCARVKCNVIEGLRKCGSVHLTVSSHQETYLELNWITDCDKPGDVTPDFIMLSRKNVRDRDEDPEPLARIRFQDYPHGYYRTRIKFGQPWMPGNWEYSENLTRADPGTHCFPYWIAATKGSYIIDSNCLAIQPTWMNDNRHIIGQQRVGNLFIPGSHNSGSFNGIPSFLQDYVLNQDRDVWSQLVFGIRYLDFRIGYYENEGFFINHDLVRVTKIEPLFKQIRKFVELAPYEIIIVDFHRFPYPSNFSQSLHRRFTDLVDHHLGDLALSPSGLQVGKGPSLNEIWAQGKNLIICYADRATVRDNFWLWHPMQQYWANTKRVSQLKSFMARSIREHVSTVNPLWALMSELTPQPLDIIFRTNNLRKLAEEANKHVTKWFRDDWFSQVNVVATDYFLGNDLINIAIEVNVNK